MDPILDTTFLHELVEQRGARLQRAATAHAARSSDSARSVAKRGRTRRHLAGALRHLAERIEPHRLEIPAPTH